MPIVTLSTTEPKYVDAPTCACQNVKKLITNKKKFKLTNILRFKIKYKFNINFKLPTY